MHESGTAARGSLGDAGESLKHSYRATKDEAHDAALTTKVKTALLEDQTTRHFTIHVSSDHGSVTLTGVVDSPQLPGVRRAWPLPSTGYSQSTTC